MNENIPVFHSCTYFEDDDEFVYDEAPDNMEYYFVPDNYIVTYENYKVKRSYPLNFIQKVFVLFEDGNSSVGSKVVGLAVASATIISVVLLILSTVPELKQAPLTCSNPACYNDVVLCPGTMICEPMPPAVYNQINTVCLYVFVIDYFFRFCLCSFVPLRVANLVPESYDSFTNENGKEIENPKLFREHFERPDPYYPKYIQFLYYLKRPMNIIDLIAVLPFFFLFTAISQKNLFVVRILRLAKTIRIFKLGKSNQNINIVVKALSKSSGALLILGFFSIIGVIVFGSLIYFFEIGHFDVTPEFPLGNYYSKTVNGYGEQPSMFTSILVSIYWACTTVTTVGYGDYVATTYGGRFIAVMAMYAGVFVLALPISIIGNNFGDAFDKVHGGKAETVAKCITTLASKLDITSQRLQNQGMLNNLSPEALDKFILTSHKAKKFSSLLVLTKCMCTTNQQKEFIRLLQSKGFDEIVKVYKNHSKLSVRQSGKFSPVKSHSLPGSIEASDWKFRNLQELQNIRKNDINKQILNISNQINEIIATKLINNKKQDT